MQHASEKMKCLKKKQIYFTKVTRWYKREGTIEKNNSPFKG